MKRGFNFALLNSVLIVIVILVLFLFYKPVHEQDPYMSIVSKLSGHSQLSAYSNLVPSVTMITKQAVQLYRTNNMTFFDNATPGDYLIQYPGAIAIYRYRTNQLVNFYEQPRAPKDLMKKVFAHPELKSFIGEQPVITLLSKQFLATADKNNVSFFKDARPGDYLLQFRGGTAIYNYEGDKIISFVKPQTLPKDFSKKLLAHKIMSNYINKTGTVTLLTRDILASLKKTNSDIYKDVPVGDYAVKYNDRLVIYDYKNDSIVKYFNIKPR